MEMESTTIKTRSEEFLRGEVYTDCKFLVGAEGDEKRFKAHKVLMAIASPVFEAMFFGNLSEKGVVRVTDVTPESFQLILNFIYLRVVEFESVHEALGVCRAAHKYIMPDLVEICNEYIYIHVTTNNVWPVLQLAVEQNNINLRECALQIFREETMSALEDCNLETTTLEALEAVLDEDKLNIDTELTLYYALLRWSRKECQRQNLPESQENMRYVSGDAWTKIRFLTLDPEEFANGPGDLSFLSAEEALSFFMNGLIQTTERISLAINTKSKRREAEQETTIKYIKLFHLPLLHPQFFKSEGTVVINEVFQLKKTQKISSFTLPTQTCSALPINYLNSQGKPFGDTYKECIRVVLNNKGVHWTHVTECYNPWNDIQKFIICEGCENQTGLCCNCLIVNGGEELNFKIYLGSSGWFPLTLAPNEHKNYRLIKSSCSRTHRFLKYYSVSY